MHKENQHIVVIDPNNSRDFFIKLREKSGLTQSQAARESKIAQQTISLMEKQGIRLRTNWEVAGRLLKTYAKHGAPSCFALIFNNGTLLTEEAIPSLYTHEQTLELTKDKLRDQLAELLKNLDG